MLGLSGSILQGRVTLQRLGTSPFATAQSGFAESVELNCSVPENTTIYKEMVRDYKALQTKLNVTSGYLASYIPGDSVYTGDDDEWIYGNCSNPTALAAGDKLCGCRVAECTFGNLITDSLSWVSGSEIAIVNGGAIRGSLAKGPISEADILETLPFLNEVHVLAAVSGSVIREALEHSIGALRACNGAAADDGTSDCNDDISAVPDGRFLQVSGVAFDWGYISSEPTINNIQVKSGGVWTELNASSTYSLAVSAYLREGGDGYSMFSGLDYEDLGSIQGACVAQYLQNKSSLTKPFDVDLDGRITQASAPTSLPTPLPTALPTPAPTASPPLIFCIWGKENGPNSFCVAPHLAVVFIMVPILMFVGVAVCFYSRRTQRKNRKLELQLEAIKNGANSWVVPKAALLISQISDYSPPGDVADMGNEVRESNIWGFSNFIGNHTEAPVDKESDDTDLGSIQLVHQLACSIDDVPDSSTSLTLQEPESPMQEPESPIGSERLNTTGKTYRWPRSLTTTDPKNKPLLLRPDEQLIEIDVSIPEKSGWLFGTVMLDSGSSKAMQKGDQVEVTKVNSTILHEIVTVVDPDWKGLVKVICSDGKTRSYKREELLSVQNESVSGGGHGLSRKESDFSNEGWFPKELIHPPTAAQFRLIQNHQLLPPDTWSDRHSTKVKLVEVDPKSDQRTQREYEKVTKEFLRTMCSPGGCMPNGAHYEQPPYPGVKILKLSRIENLDLYQLYAAKKQSIELRGKEEKRDVSNYEKKMLFHGANSAVIPLIYTQGFNRSFSGKNMCKYGKGSDCLFVSPALFESHLLPISCCRPSGVYFARDARFRLPLPPCLN